MGIGFGFPKSKTRQFASFLVLADLGGLRGDLLNNSYTLASFGRLLVYPDLHHPGFLQQPEFLHRYKIH
jgi:hypothetical protein